VHRRLAPLALAATLALAPLARGQAPAPAPSPTLVTFNNALPSTYRLTRVRLIVDGAVRFDGPRFESIVLTPGGHVVELIADYRLHSSIFTYLDRYGIEVRSAHLIRPGSPIKRVDARVVRAGGATTPLERSATIAWVDR
jgi:hypothetical protein